MKSFSISILCVLVPVITLIAFANQSSGQVHAYLDYDPAFGSLAVDTVSTSNAITTFELKSPDQFLIGVDPPTLDGLFDVYVPNRIFKLEPGGFFDIDFGPILSAGLAPQELAANLCVDGSVIQGGALTRVELRSGDGSFPVPRQCSFDPDFNPNPVSPGPNPNPRPQLPQSSGSSFFLDLDSASGLLAVNSPKSWITTLELTTTSELFMGPKPASLEGIFDVYAPNKIFHLQPNGFQTLDLENALASGVSAETLAREICYRGSGGASGSLYVRTDGVVHPVACGAPAETIDLAAAMDPNADIGVFIDPEGGNLVVQVPGDPDGAFKPLTHFEISANKDVFLSGNKISGTLDGSSDVLTETRLLKIDQNGFGTIDFGPIIHDGVSLGDLDNLDGVFRVTAIFDGGELVNSVQLVSFATVPEPSTALMLLVAVPLLFRRPHPTRSELGELQSVPARSRHR